MERLLSGIVHDAFLQRGIRVKKVAVEAVTGPENHLNENNSSANGRRARVLYQDE